MIINYKVKSIATSLFSRVLVMCFGIALFFFLGPTIFASIVNPRVWYDALIAIYFFLTAIFAIVFFFSRKMLYLLIILPALVYFPIALVWQWVY
jgi:hypothetical protein